METMTERRDGILWGCKDEHDDFRVDSVGITDKHMQMSPMLTDETRTVREILLVLVAHQHDLCLSIHLRHPLLLPHRLLLGSIFHDCDVRSEDFDQT